MYRWCAFILCWLIVSTAVRADDSLMPPTTSQLDFFEKKIRPVLIKHCYRCHSAEAHDLEQLKGGLRVDTRDALLAGGDSGPAVVTGQPGESLLLDALKYETFQMPPEGQLPESVIHDFETWIEMGAPDPRRETAPLPVKQFDLAAGQRHWAYQPLVTPPLPDVGRADWPRNGIDRYVLAGLERLQVKPVGDAARHILIRRLYYDLTGMPPSPDDVAAFLNDSSPEATERLVDRLLQSPRFGERWARHWLDVVRYAESLTLRGLVLPHAWRYRDYVIDAFNRDLPFDQFVREQVSGDLLEASTPDERARQCVATTFLALGNNNLEEQDKQQLRMDVVDEQLDVITRGFLAQTVTCARCHDHKFDPIPTRDYYALAGILRNAQTLEHANVSKWLELPLPTSEAVTNHYALLETEIASSRQTIEALKKDIQRQTAAAGIQAANVVDVILPGNLAGIVIDDAQARRVGAWTLSQSSRRYIGAGYLHDQDGDKGQKTLTFQPELPQAGLYEVRLAYTAGSNRTTTAPVTVFSADGETTIEVNQQQTPSIDGRFVSLGTFRFESNGAGFVIVSNTGTRGHVIADAVQFLPVLDGSPAGDVPTVASLTETEATSAEKQAAQAVVKLKDDLKAEEQKLDRLVRELAQRPVYISVREEPTIEDCRVHIRGTVHNLGSSVPRGFLSVLPNCSGPVSATTSGRRELGIWLSSADNPLTARVMANRIWHWLIGSGIVRTVDNFGTTGELPSDQVLLDHLAVEFRDHGWSVKHLVRQIVLSRTYQLASISSPELTTADPENRYFGRAFRKRQEAECLLDAMLVTSGTLDQAMGGPTLTAGTNVDFGYQFTLRRRAIYWPILRNALPEIYEVFDFPDPSLVAGRRNTSTVAPQALFLLNSPLVTELSQNSAEQLLREIGNDDSAAIDLLFQRIICRMPTADEKQTLLNFVAHTPDGTHDARQERWSLVVQSLFSSIDFRFID